MVTIGDVNTSTILLEALRVGRRAGECWLLRDISLRLHAGEPLAIVGPTGSGKTVLLRALAMLDPIQQGDIRFRGRAGLNQLNPRFRAEVIYLHQRPPLIEGTVEENLRRPFALKVHRKRRFDRNRIIELLESLGRDETFLANNTRDLSGGESQLVGLLRAVQLDPAVLLLDEPTAALDAATAGGVERLVNAWLKENPHGRSLIWVTHNVQQAARVAADSLNMNNGQLQRGG